MKFIYLTSGLIALIAIIVLAVALYSNGFVPLAYSALVFLAPVYISFASLAHQRMHTALLTAIMISSLMIQCAAGMEPVLEDVCVAHGSVAIIYAGIVLFSKYPKWYLKQS